MYDVTALGEVLIDFTPSGYSDRGGMCFERNPGGAPANVLACVSRLGGKTAFIGKVGNDMFGRFLSGALRDYGIDTSGLRISDSANTTLAFVQPEKDGERSFGFYRNPGADTMLEPDEIELSVLKNSRIFHFGSLSLTDEPSRTATGTALKYARENGCIISYDPNLRPPLWKSLRLAHREITSVLGLTDILKVSKEELEFITGEKDPDTATYKLYEEYKIPLILVTLGNKGCYFRNKELKGTGKAYNVKTVDTTGAGDAFLGSFLYCMAERNIKEPGGMDLKDIEQIIAFSGAAAAISTTKRGAMPAMPELNEVIDLISKD